DLRPADDYALGHIAGAKHLDLYQVSLTNSPSPSEILKVRSLDRRFRSCTSVSAMLVSPLLVFRNTNQNTNNFLGCSRTL
ncbi:rhodanese-like domain-containing protein, partial [Alphaproteobacteria bacterium]|nr:rhodanese-like domain-containing protein [Alphaproteobacteria bacterium]